MKLETRKCTNKNCARTFRVWEQSKQVTCSNSCTDGPFGAPAKSKGGEPATDEAAAVEPVESEDASARPSPEL